MAVREEHRDGPGALDPAATAWEASGRRFARVPEDDAEAVARFLAGDRWPFHGAAAQTLAQARERATTPGLFLGGDAVSFWVHADGAPPGAAPDGLVTLRELEDPTPVFDLRLRAAARRRGHGRAALAFLLRWTFADPARRRLEGHTRADNAPMRGLFRACGWVQEAHHRRAWPDEAGGWHDAVTYAVLREDWLAGATTPAGPLDRPPAADAAASARAADGSSAPAAGAPEAARG